MPNEFKFHLELPKPSEVETPEWVHENVTDVLGFDRNSRLEITGLDELNAELDRLNAMRTEFQGELQPFRKNVEKNKLHAEELLQLYYKVQDSINTLNARFERALSDSRPKFEAIDRRKDLVEKAIRQAEASERARKEFDAITARFNEIKDKMPWAEIIKQHQSEGAAKMAYCRKMILADVMGLGKTLTSIATCDTIKEQTVTGDIHFNGLHTDTYAPAGRRILYMCPANLDTNIQKEFRKWATHRGNPIFLSKQTRNARRLVLGALKESDVDCTVIVNYEAWVKDKLLINDLIEMEFDTVILDEAHHLKERDTIKYRGVIHLLEGKDFTEEDKDGVYWTPQLKRSTGEFYDQPRFVFPMTGTPVLNKPQELYTLLTLVDPNNHSPDSAGENRWLKTYCEQNPWTKRWKFRDGPDGLEKLAKEISNLYLRRTLADAGIVLPPQDPVYHELEIDEQAFPEQAKARNDMRAQALLMLEGKVVSKAKAQIAVTMRLRQIETLARGIKIALLDEDGEATGEYRNFNCDQSQKLDYLIHENSEGYEGLIPEVCPDQRTVVYSQFTEPLEELHARCEAMGLRSIILYGGTSQKVREQIRLDVDRYYVEQKGGSYDYDIILCNYKVGAEGINFTHTTQMIFLDDEWNPGKEEQAAGRQHRMGQTENCTLHFIRVKNTIDIWMAALIQEKRDNVDSFDEANVDLATKMKNAIRAGEM